MVIRIPDIKLENSKGLSNEQLEELLKILILQAKHLIGEVIILNSFRQIFLYFDYN